MKIKLHSAIFLLLLAFAPLTQAVLPLPKDSNLTEFSSKESKKFLEKSMDSNSLKLLSQFETQKTTTYCGVASLVMVLNSSGIKPPDDPLHKPYQYFTQDNFFNADVEKIIPASDVEKKGITLDQLNEIALALGLKSEAFHADQFRSEEDFKKFLTKAMSKKKFIIVNFARSGLHLEGGGHHSPLAAYDEKRDRFLLLDVARYKYPSYWVKTKDLWKAIYTEDSDAKKNKWRGILVVTANSPPSPTVEIQEEDLLETQE